MGSVAGIVDEVVSGHREVKIYGGRNYESTRFDAVADENRRLNLKIASTNALSTSLVQLVAACSLAAVIFVATRPGIIQHMDPGSFMSVITSMMVMLTSLKQLTTVQAGMQRGIAAAQDLFGVIDTPSERDEGHARVERCRGDIELRGVELQYSGQIRGALNGVDLKCAGGTVTALVGPSGGGKTSLVSLLPRFYEPTAGEILLDGRVLSDYSITSLREQIAWVGQKVVLFNDTVARNIAYGSLAGASRAAIEDAASAANAMEFISRLPQGLDSSVGEGGALSLRWSAPAHRDRARVAQERADPDPRRSHQRARQRIRAADPERAGAPDARSHRARDRASAVDDRARRPDRRARGRPRRRTWHACRAARTQRPLRHAAPHAVSRGCDPAHCSGRHLSGRLVSASPIAFTASGTTASRFRSG